MHHGHTAWQAAIQQGAAEAGRRVYAPAAAEAAKEGVMHIKTRIAVCCHVGIDVHIFFLAACGYTDVHIPLLAASASASACRLVTA